MGNLAGLLVCLCALGLLLWLRPKPSRAGLTEPVRELPEPEALQARPSGPRAWIYQARLDRAGWSGNAAFESFMRWRLLAAVLAVSLAIVVWALCLSVGARPWLAGAAAFLTATIGLLLPELYLFLRAGVRTRLIERDLLLVLDLLVSLVEAGLGLDDALRRIVVGTKDRGPLTVELDRLDRELRGGVPRARAYRGFAARVRVPEIHAIVASIVQGERHGSGLSRILRTQSEMLRGRVFEKVRMQAERLAVRMVFPTVLCFLPSVILLGAGPFMLRILEFLNVRLFG